MSLIALDPRQTLAISNYKDPTSETFGNLAGSLLKAGFDDQYARSVHGRMPEWLTQNIKNDVALIQTAEANLKRYAELKITLDGKSDIDLAKLQVDVSKFLLKTLARKKYSEDSEVTPPNVQINIVNYNAKKDGDQAKGEVKEAEVK